MGSRPPASGFGVLECGLSTRKYAAATATPAETTYVTGTVASGTVVATIAGWRTDFLNQMGLVIADSIRPFGADHRAVIPRDHIKAVLDSADVVIWTTESPDDQKALLADPDVAASQATAQNRHIFTTKDQAGAIAFASPLSYPLVADQLSPLIGKILG